MSKHTLKEWVAVTRFWSFPVSAMPVVVTFAYLCSRHLVPAGPDAVLNFILALIGVVILHSAGNVLSDWSDYRSGVDNENACAVPNLVFHHFEPREYLIFSILLFIIGCIIGIVLVLRTGIGLLLIGGTGVLLTAAYSYLKYRALGDLDIFLIFSVLIILGTTFSVTGDIVPEALVLALPVGLITVSVLHANNTVDIQTDSAAGIRTFAMSIGGKASSCLYISYMIIPFVCIAAAVICGWLHPMCLLSLAAVPQAYKNIRKASRYDAEGISALGGLDQASAQLQLVFSILLSAGLFISCIF